jgi:uncharacterized protein (TIGR02466 family)|tara:strand:- start:50 stop:631 length:582 start_codon:yes stop_codon:yes gene_type:complete
MKGNIAEIFRYDLYDVRLNFDLNRLQKFCFELQHNDQGRKKSNVGGWQSNDLHDEFEIIKNLREIITQHLNTFARYYKINKNLKLSNLWININEYKDSNMIHSHPNSVFSGVYYIKTPKDSGNLTFHNPYEDFTSAIYNDNVSGYDTKNSSIYYFEPQENMLLFFPSYMKHSVSPCMNKTEKRISISFNSIIK